LLPHKRRSKNSILFSWPEVMASKGLSPRRRFDSPRSNHKTGCQAGDGSSHIPAGNLPTLCNP
jgi:hypothetical protein